MTRELEQLLELLECSRHVVAFTGAGISTLSGIPDFRGEDGVFSKQFKGYDIETIHDIHFFTAHPDIFYEYAKNFIYNLTSQEPNIIHNVLAEMEKCKLLDTVYTQNIDALHQRAGSVNVREFHGSMSRHHCMKCGRKYGYDAIAEIVKSGQVPYCQFCEGLIKPGIVFFSEHLDKELLATATEEIAGADLLLVLGSSLTVPPAAKLPLGTYYGGGKIVIVNRQPTYLDRYAALKFDDLKIVFETLSGWL